MNQDNTGSESGGMNLHGRIEKQAQLPFKNAVEIAWKNIRVRLARSLLVTSGIILALAFLTYILCSDALARYIVQEAPKRGMGKFVETLQRNGVLASLNDADARVQTWWLVGLALLVSFVGILNSMLLSVTERFKEIGTMKCLGALNGLIVQLFLLESTFQGIVGTVIGIFIGIVLTFAEGTARYGMVMWQLIPTVELLALSGLCLLAGTGLTIVGALYPAWRAARMQPVDAMRSEI